MKRPSAASATKIKPITTQPVQKIRLTRSRPRVRTARPRSSIRSRYSASAPRMIARSSPRGWLAGLPASVVADHSSAAVRIFR